MKWKDVGIPLDLDGDGKNDIFFAVYTNRGGWSGVREAYFYTSEEFTFYSVPLKEREIISPSLAWYVKDDRPYLIGESPWTLASTSSFSYGAKPFNRWENKSFLAVKKVEGKKVKFGCVELSVSDYNEITIYRFGMQR